MEILLHSPARRQAAFGAWITLVVLCSVPTLLDQIMVLPKMIRSLLKL